MTTTISGMYFSARESSEPSIPDYDDDNILDPQSQPTVTFQFSVSSDVFEFWYFLPSLDSPTGDLPSQVSFMLSTIIEELFPPGTALQFFWREEAGEAILLHGAVDGVIERLCNHARSAELEREPSSWRNLLQIDVEIEMRDRVVQPRETLRMPFELERFKYEESKGAIDSERLKCVVCLEKVSAGTEVVRLACSHVFHEDCVMPWLLNHHTCPTCRYKLPTVFEDQQN